MSRRMSCSLTVDAVRARTKTVTRRTATTWQSLAPGDRLTLVEKGMGLAKGTRQVVLAEVEIVDVRVEPITAIVAEDNGTTREGFPDMGPWEFAEWWAKTHGVHPTDVRLTSVMCRRIEWRYL